jgi:hypothetical protein
MGLTVEEISRLHKLSKRLEPIRGGGAEAIDEDVGTVEGLFPKEKSSVELIREYRRRSLAK